MEISIRRIKRKLEHYKRAKEQLEQHPIVRAVLEFEKAPPAEKRKIINDWHNYYKKVRETQAYLRYDYQTTLVPKNDINQIKQLAEEAWEQRVNQNWQLIKPVSIDYETEKNSSIFQLYRFILSQIEELRRQLEKAGGYEADY